MNFLRLFFLTACFAALSVAAQDLGPIKVDLEGYIDDSKNELLTPEEPIKKEPVKEVKKEEPKKTTAGGRPRRSTAPSTENKTAPVTENKPIKKIGLNSFKTQESDPTMMYMIIGGAVLLIIIIIVVVVMLKKKAANKRKANYTEDPDISLADKIDAHEQAVAAETTEGQEPVAETTSAVPFAEGEEHHTPTTTKEMADHFARETALNEKGQNASGIIIDEDKYFDGSASFVDEDFSDMDGPHDEAPPEAPPAETPNLPPS